MQEVNKDIFYQITKDWEDVPFSQCEGWVCMQSGDNPERVRYYLDEQIGCAAHVKRFAGLTLLMIDSECFKHRHIKPVMVSRFYDALKSTDIDMIEVNSRRIYQPEHEVGIRQAGFLRPIGSFSFELTNLVDLTKPLSFNENWKRNLKISESEKLSFARIQVPSDSDIEDFMHLYQEMSSHKNLSIPFTKKLLQVLLNDSHFRLCFISNKEERIAGIIYHHVHTHAGLLYAANGNKANESHAGFEMYRQLLTLLASEGVKTFDMEKMGASTRSTNAVYFFKQGIHGQLTSLCGEWSWYKHQWYGIGMYFVKKYLWKKVQA